MADSLDRQVDFGRRKVTPKAKTALVGEVFSRVAKQYDVVNDLLSLGSHRLLKKLLMEYTGLREGYRALDVAGGTGDLAFEMHNIVGKAGEVTLLDINEAMILKGRDRLIDSGLSKVQFVLGNAEHIPFPDNYFHAATIGFGLRNITNKDRALREINRVLKPSGHIAVLEFAKSESVLIAGAASLFQSTWPYIGRLIVGDPNPYAYLVDSISSYPSPVIVEQMLVDANFVSTGFSRLLGGVVTIHFGAK